ncbi:AI-2E family transporter [Crocosphaera sp. UHCC 0190]|uniref:AI-2E family transporter n=1 Tax=Crocosphaera sp. UHCC 0190 TaxID=3110246 RepID=UPI002B1F3201|nr:AI-2E family transporter [Crocosphaera sp. UHCC 0190]MEA5511018.1 AI-2E family transporter [Crocosphaera sp. UHCC 0190]
MLEKYANRFNIPGCFFIALVFPLVVLNVWVFVFVFNAFQGIFSSFIIAGFFALLLNHPIHFLNRRLNLSRGNSILMVFLSFIVIFALIAIILVPAIVIRFSELVHILPDWIQSATLKADSLSNWTNNSKIVDNDRIFTNLSENFQNQLQGFLEGIPDFIFGTIGNILNIFFIFVLTIFFLSYGNSLLRNCLQSWFSPNLGVMIQKTLYRNFNSYILNQLILATVLTVTMIPTLFILKAPFPLLFGLAIGIAGFIPFGAVVTILGISFILLLADFWTGLRVLVVVLLLDQIIENTLPPRLLGKLTGLNPIVILFSVMVGATLGDFIGLITAVPIAATIKSLMLTLNQAETEELDKIPSELPNR